MAESSAFQQDSRQSRYRRRYLTVEPYIQGDFKSTPYFTVNADLHLSFLGTYRTEGSNVYNWNAKNFDTLVAKSRLRADVA